LTKKQDPASNRSAIQWWETVTLKWKDGVECGHTLTIL